MPTKVAFETLGKTYVGQPAILRANSITNAKKLIGKES